MSRRILLVAGLALVAAAACSTSSAARVEPTDATAESSSTSNLSSATVDTATTPTPTQPTKVDLIAQRFASRPFGVFVPSSITPGVPAPLIVLLHGYSGSGTQIEDYFGLEPVAEQRGMLLVHPSGTVDEFGLRFWDATDACCRRSGDPVDDSGYLLDVIDAVSERYAVDPDRIWLVGHSNGGFMSYRMACDHADRIAAIVSLAGTGFVDASRCSPSAAVSVLQIHGTADRVIDYDGGEIFDHPYPGALDTLSGWMTNNSCGGTLVESGERLDLDTELEDDDTTVLRAEACPPGIAVELWRIDEGAHSPVLSPDFASLVIDFLQAHPKVR